MAESSENSALKISFQAKETIVCPVCEESFHREELLSGSGRLIAGELTDELHRLYEPSLKYGDIYPLSYQATVCPSCWFASMAADFSKLPKDKIEDAANDENNRKIEAAMIYDDVDFTRQRGLGEGVISQYLVLRCYDFYPIDFSPTVKQGLAALRTGWLLDDLDKKDPNQHYDWLSLLFKKKALFFYKRALELEQSAKEKLSGLANLGPDTDKNYGYEGLLYIIGLLEYKYGDTSHAERRREVLGECKRMLAKMFGMGKSSKSKPGPLMEKSRALYDAFAKELDEFDE